MLFSSEENSAAGKARDLLGAAAGAAKQELVAEAKSLTAAVLPVNSLPAFHTAPTPQPGTPLPPIHVRYPISAEGLLRRWGAC